MFHLVLFEVSHLDPLHLWVLVDRVGEGDSLRTRRPVLLSTGGIHHPSHHLPGHSLGIFQHTASEPSSTEPRDPLVVRWLVRASVEPPASAATVLIGWTSSHCPHWLDLQPLSSLVGPPARRTAEDSSRPMRPIHRWSTYLDFGDISFLSPNYVVVVQTMPKLSKLRPKCN